MSGAERMNVGIVLERQRVERPWAEERWRPIEVLPGEPPAEPWAVLAEGDGWQRVYAGTAVVELFPGETAGYRDNLASPCPSVFVILRRGGPHGIAIHAATVDPGEIEAHSDSGDDLIEPFRMPAPIACWVQAFVDRHHVERPFYKRQRDRVDPEALAPRRHDRMPQHERR
jgi:hypothetical protein